MIAAGHNAHIAWGITSGLDDDDDLYVERLKGKERYRFKGRTRKMSCRTERFAVAGAKTVRQRICRTVHGPVQARRGKTAFARRYAIWKHELGTLKGLAALDQAGSVSAAGSAVAKLTWNENTLVADDGGHIGWWHPGRLPLRPKRWDERLPLPGTGEAEWRGLLKFRALPKVIDPEQGWLAELEQPAVRGLDQRRRGGAGGRRSPAPRRLPRPAGEGRRRARRATTRSRRSTGRPARRRSSGR